MKDIGFGISIEVLKFKEGTGLHIKNDWSEREMVE